MLNYNRYKALAFFKFHVNVLVHEYKSNCGNKNMFEMKVSKVT